MQNILSLNFSISLKLSNIKNIKIRQNHSKNFLPSHNILFFPTVLIYIYIIFILILKVSETNKQVRSWKITTRKQKKRESKKSSNIAVSYKTVSILPLFPSHIVFCMRHMTVWMRNNKNMKINFLFPAACAKEQKT